MGTSTAPADGEIYTYTYLDGTSVQIDVSGIDEITIHYIDGAGGGNSKLSNGGSGGKVEDAVVDVSEKDYIYLWVGQAGGDNGAGYTPQGRYNGGDDTADVGGGGASTEISFSNTSATDSSDESHIAGAGGGAGGGDKVGAPPEDLAGSGGARAGTGYNNAEGTGQPYGGDGNLDADGGDGEGHVADITEVTNSGTTTTGGGSGSGTDGEIKIEYTGGVGLPTVATQEVTNIGLG